MRRMEKLEEMKGREGEWGNKRVAGWALFGFGPFSARVRSGRVGPNISGLVSESGKI